MSRKKIVVPVADDNYTGEGGGVYGFISWQSVEQMLRRMNQVRNGEIVPGLYVDEAGIHFKISKE